MYGLSPGMGARETQNIRYTAHARTRRGVKEAELTATGPVRRGLWQLKDGSYIETWQCGLALYLLISYFE